ncbi:MAG TPA: hypothetical protein EYQ18_01275 [Candidatus Handelsmanbacteria bacterium]|nr:hypothetical protein [Candidatus Handelsmanbacteria bacterium]
MRRIKIGVAAMAVLLVSTAGAEEYQIDSEHSSVAFSIRHLVRRTSGQFNEFSGSIHLEALGTATHPYNKKPVAGFETRTVFLRSDYAVNSWTDAASVLGDEVKVRLTIEAIGGE